MMPENTEPVSVFNASRVVVGVELVDLHTVFAGKEWGGGGGGAA